MKLAKPYIDVGIQTNNKQPMLDFWQHEAGLPYEELLKVGGGNHQHRHSLNGSVFKLNHLRDQLPKGEKTGYEELLIARKGLQNIQSLVDPDGNKVSLVPHGYEGITHIGLRMEVGSIAASRRFYKEVLNLEEINETCFRWSSTLFFLSENPRRAFASDMRGPGYRYITVQVHDVDLEHKGIVDRGGVEGRPPATLGKVARISFIKDPDGNWIEVSQRASLTGEIPQ